jgi:hypothetical protein
MHRFMLTCFSIAGLCGLLGTANAATLNTPAPLASAISVVANAPGTDTNLQGQAGTPQFIAQNLQGQATTNPKYTFSVAPPPNANGSPIPTGG